VNVRTKFEVRILPVPEIGDIPTSGFRGGRAISAPPLWATDRRTPKHRHWRRRSVAQKEGLSQASSTLANIVAVDGVMGVFRGAAALQSPKKFLLLLTTSSLI